MRKKNLLPVMLLAFSTVNAQKDVAPDPKNNEIRLNVTSPFMGGAIEGTYERILNAKSSVGIKGLYVFSTTKNRDMNYFISPYYRRYFGNKQASGWFVEGFGMLTSIDGKKIYTSADHSSFTENPDVMDVALGAGGGWKWVSESGFLVEASFTYGGLLFNARKTDHTIVSKFGVSVGYRF